MRTHKLNFPRCWHMAATPWSSPLPTLNHTLSPLAAFLIGYLGFNRLNLGSFTHASEHSLNRNVWLIVFFLVVLVNNVCSWSHNAFRTLLHRVFIDKFWQQIYFYLLWFTCSALSTMVRFSWWVRPQGLGKKELPEQICCQSGGKKKQTNISTDNWYFSRYPIMTLTLISSR